MITFSAFCEAQKQTTILHDVAESLTSHDIDPHFVVRCILDEMMLNASDADLPKLLEVERQLAEAGALGNFATAVGNGLGAVRNAFSQGMDAYKNSTNTFNANRPQQQGQVQQQQGQQPDLASLMKQLNTVLTSQGMGAAANPHIQALQSLIASKTAAANTDPAQGGVPNPSNGTVQTQAAGNPNQG